MISRYRALTESEIDVLEANGCRAEDWATVTVAEGFDARRVLRTDFYGTVEIGAMTETVEVSKGFVKHSGIVNATCAMCVWETTVWWRMSATISTIIPSATAAISPMYVPWRRQRVPPMARAM